MGSPTPISPSNDSDVDSLLEVLPENVKKSAAHIISHQNDKRLIEIVIDSGRLPLLKFSNGLNIVLEDCSIVSNMKPFVNNVTNNGTLSFTTRNRIGVPGTLHRISAIPGVQPGNFAGLVKYF